LKGVIPVMLNLGDSLAHHAPNARRPFRAGPLPVAVAGVWALLLIAGNGSQLPTEKNITADHVVAALTPANFAKLCRPTFRYIKGASVFRSPTLPACSGAEPKSLSVPAPDYELGRTGLSTRIYFRTEVSDEDAQAVIADFDATLERAVSRSRTTFVLMTISWWAISTSLWLVLIWALIRRLKIELWHSRRLLLLWFVAATIACVWRGSSPSGLITFLSNSIRIPYLSFYGLLPLIVPVVAITTCVFFAHVKARIGLARRTDKQWFVIWVATILIALIWWDGISTAAETRASTSPEVRQYVRDGFVSLDSVSAHTLAYESEHRKAYRAELTKRLFGSVIVLAAFGVWYFGRRDEVPSDAQ
jgi:hypothetical protein